MEDCLIKIYINPILNIRRLNLNQMIYFYRYFKQELFFLCSFRFFEQVNDKRFNRDKRKLKRIINVMRTEIKRRKSLLALY